jgi:hypothetical protein
MTCISDALIIAVLMLPEFAFAASGIDTLASGQQPQIAIDNQGVLRIIYGRGDEIYCATSADNGVTFSDIRLVGEVKQMHLGMSRGPQVASSENYTLISAIDQHGSIHTFQLNHRSRQWMQTALVNDIDGSAPEGLMSLAADQKDNFYAVWLDIRNDKHNKICFASSKDQGMSWSKNSVLYKSPDQHVCECCKPNIAASESRIYVMFRNWLHGSRDLYLLQSEDGDAKFSDPIKLGNGTWKLNGCPMDGGGLMASAGNVVSTVWQRNGEIYYSKPSEAEKKIGSGTRCSISDPENPIITWQDGGRLKLKEMRTGQEFDLGEGSFLKSIRTKDDKILCTWEKEGEIFVKKF